MRKIRVLFVLFLLCACAVKQPMSIPERYIHLRSTLAKIPMVYPVQDAVNDKHLVNLQAEPYVYNQSILKSFVDKVKLGMDAELIFVAYTDEGDPILTIVQYADETFLAVVDTTRDRFGRRSIEEFKFLKLVTFKEANNNGYYLFNTDVTYEQFKKSLISSNSADWIDHLYLCHD
ncbi:MAG: DUF4362 domain-containing protein [Erysipelotrichaceae bacterium]